MKNYKLIDILKKFDGEEILLLKQFVLSPYFVKQQSVIEFATIVLTEFPSFESLDLDDQALYKLLYPGKKYKRTTIFKLMNQMIACINQFLTIENFRKDYEDQGPRLLEELRKKGIGSEFQRVSSKLNDEFETGKKDQEHYYHLMRFENELDTYYNLSKEHVGYSQYLQKKANALDTFFISSKLRIVCDMVNRKNILSYDYEISMLDVILDYVESDINRFENHSAVSIYYRILLTLTKPAIEENYFKLIELLDRASNDFTREELKEMYIYAKNYCIKQLNSGRVDYESHLFNLYCKLIETGLIYDNHIISQWDYKNIISTSLRLSEFQWTENFIQYNKEKLHPDFREVAYNYNLASLLYEKKDFPGALRTLNLFNDAMKKVSDPQFNDTFYNLDSRTMFLKIYFESNEDETLWATIESFKSYLVRNKKLSERQRKIYLNLLKYTKKLIHQRDKLLENRGSRVVKYPIRYSVKKLKNEISLDKNIVNLSWLLARIDEFEKELD